MDWRAKMRTGLDPAKMTGAEIGALTKPAITRDEGRIFYVDHASTPELKRKYANDPNVNVEDIVEVDVVWGDSTLLDLFRPIGKLDYILASHVVEHVPDMITWFQELRSVLKPGGRVNLIVPDKRFTFDYMREETRLADVLAAYLLRARRPLPQQIIDHVLHAASVDLAAIWERRLDPRMLVPTAPPSAAIAVARDSLEHGSYHDVHCWVLTPKGLAALCRRLVEMDLLDFECERFYDTKPHSLDFFISLRESTDRAVKLRSWDRMFEEAEDDPIGKAGLRTASPFADEVPDKIEPGELERLRRQLEDASERERTCSQALAVAERRVAAIENSTSWRVTSLGRAVARFVRPEHRPE